MSRVKDILQMIKRERGRAGAHQKRVFPDSKPSVLGRCVNNAEIARRVDGQHWRSDETDVRSWGKDSRADGSSQHREPGHSVAVIRTRGKAGIIADYSDARRPIQAPVTDVTDPKEVKETLHRLYKDDGWRKVR